MGNAKITTYLAVAIFVMMTGHGFADMYLQDGGTWNLATEISTSVYVDLATSGNPTTVNVLEGANLRGSPVAIQSNNNAHLNISGGSISNYFNARNNSDVNVSGGNIYWLRHYDNSTANVSNGSISFLYSYNTSTVNISGGNLVRPQSWNSSIMNISGGTISNYLDSHDTCTTNVSGGTIRYLRLYDTSTANISGGNVDTVQDFNSCTLEISGGSVGELQSWNSSIMNISGGTISNHLYAAETSTVNISGGNINELRVVDSSNVILNGYEFVLGTGLSWDGDSRKILGHGVLTGKWYDGTSWSTIIHRYGETATIMLITKPSTVTASAGPNGTIDPNGDIIKNVGEEQLFVATPEPDYTVDKWMLDGTVAQFGLNTFNLKNIQKNHTIEVSFMPILAVVYVDDDNTGGPWDGTQTHPYQHIQDGVNVSSSGTKIIVMQGTYFENVSINSKNIELTSTDPNNPSVVAATIIYGGYTDSVVKITDTNDVLIEGFTITEGYNWNGGGIYILHSGITINNCIIGNNSAYIGGGIYCEDSNAIVKNCSILNNRASESPESFGGGFYGDNSNTLIDNCIFIENVAEDSGAAIYGCDGVISNSIIRNNKIPWEGHGGAISNCSGLIENCLIEGNYSNWGDGAGISRSSADIVSCVIRNNINDTGSLDVVPVMGGGLAYCDGNIINCIIVNNKSVNDSDAEQPSRGGGLAHCNGTITNCVIYGNEAYNNDYGSEGSGIYKCNGIIKNCIIWGNTTDQIYDSNASYCDIQGGWSGIGNINLDPCFVDLDSNDFHLKSEVGRWDPNSQSWIHDAITSPCIDAGDSTDTNWKNELWPHGGRINIGAYGGTPQASMSPVLVGNIADISRNGCVGVEDLLLLIEKWLIQDVLLAEDMDLNNRVDFIDFTILAENWSFCWDQDLVGYWDFNGTGGNQVYDSSTYGNHGTLMNGTVWTGNGELSFDGTDDYVSVPDSTSLDITNEITISVWVYMTQYSTNWPKLVIKPYDTADTDPWELFDLDLGHFGTYPRFILTDGIPGGNDITVSNSNYALTLGQWHNIVGTYDGTTSSLYVDGELIASGSGVINIGTNDMPLNIGGRMGIHGFKGLIDEVRIYNRAITLPEIESLSQSR